MNSAMRKKILALLPACLILTMLVTGCGTASAGAAGSDTSQVAGAQDMTDVVDVVEDGMIALYGSSLKDGTYEIAADSSSSMFKIAQCELTVAEGTMTARMTMSGTGYLYVFIGSAQEAADADPSDYIPFEENDDGTHSFTVPVEALDMGISCAAFSKNKELWYDRTLLFRADSLPFDAFADGVVTTPESLDLADGTYTVEVRLEGGSGRSSVASPATLTVSNGVCTAEIVWSSGNYDYMKVADVQYFPVNTEGNSVFEIPVTGFDYKMPVIADTTAMSQPYEIEYTLYFSSDSIEEAS